MDDTFRFADAFGPLRIIYIHRPSAGLKAIVVVDNIACGVAIGGVRMAPDVSVEECFRLARAMTWKNAAAGLRHDGGKSVIFSIRAWCSATRRRSFALSPAQFVMSAITCPDPIWEPTSCAWLGQG